MHEIHNNCYLFEKMSRSRNDNDLMIKLNNNKFILIILMNIKRLLMYQKCLIVMHAIKEN